jgi:hypothetical protein
VRTRGRRRQRLLLVGIAGIALAAAAYTGALSYQRHRAWRATRARLVGQWQNPDRGIVLDFAADGAVRMFFRGPAAATWRAEDWRTTRFEHRDGTLVIDGVPYTFRFLDDGSLEVTGDVGVPRVYRRLEPDG